MLRDASISFTFIGRLRKTCSFIYYTMQSRSSGGLHRVLIGSAEYKGQGGGKCWPNAMANKQCELIVFVHIWVVGVWQ